MMVDKVIVGLGNPGREYALTRHNLGFLVVEYLARDLGLTFKEQKQFVAATAKGKVGENKVHLLLPLTYMNESGRAVQSYLNYYELKPEQLIVATDDTALDFGQLRLRTSGSAGGHNGLKSIESALQTQDYMRLRLGIGAKHPHQALADYVLDVFGAEERVHLVEFVEKGANILKRLLNEDPKKVMNDINS